MYWHGYLLGANRTRERALDLSISTGGKLPLRPGAGHSGRSYHRGNFTTNWYANVEYNWVSDKNYFEDFGNTLSSASTTYLPQSAYVTYNNSGWSFFGRVLNYQPVDDTIPREQRFDRGSECIGDLDEEVGVAVVERR